MTVYHGSFKHRMNTSNRANDSCPITGLLFFHWSHRELWATSYRPGISGTVKTPFCVLKEDEIAKLKQIKIFQSQVPSVKKLKLKGDKPETLNANGHDFAHLTPRHLVIDRGKKKNLP